MAIAMSVGGSAVAAESSSIAGPTILANVGSVSGSGTVSVAVDQYSNYDSLGIPLTITEVPVTTVAVSGGGEHSIAVPMTAALTAAAQNGVANVQLTSTFGDEGAIASAPLQLPAETAMVAGRTATHLTTRVRFANYHRISPAERSAGKQSRLGPAPVACTWNGLNSAEVLARVGELHVANIPGASAVFLYANKADSTFGVAVSMSLDNGFTASGTASVSNSMSTVGGLPGGQGFRWYIDGHFYREEYRSSEYGHLRNPCYDNYEAVVTDSVGDVVQGTNQPPVDPWGSCQNNPNGYGSVPMNGGSWSGDRGKAVTYSGGVSMFGVSLSAETGYSNDITIKYVNHSRQVLYFCGATKPENAPVLYEN